MQVNTDSAQGLAKSSKHNCCQGYLHPSSPVPFTFAHTPHPWLYGCSLGHPESRLNRNTHSDPPACTPARCPHRPGIPDGLEVGLDTRGDPGGALRRRKEKQHYAGVGRMTGGAHQRAVHRSKHDPLLLSLPTFRPCHPNPCKNTARPKPKPSTLIHVSVPACVQAPEGRKEEIPNAEECTPPGWCHPH